MRSPAGVIPRESISKDIGHEDRERDPKQVASQNPILKSLLLHRSLVDRKLCMMHKNYKVLSPAGDNKSSRWLAAADVHENLSHTAGGESWFNRMVSARMTLPPLPGATNNAAQFGETRLPDKFSDQFLVTCNENRWIALPSWSNANP